jgi:hypothetical protein
MPKSRLTSRISFGRTAYVGRCGSKMLDAIEHSGLRLNGTGDGLVFTGYSELEEFVEDSICAKVRSKTLWFLYDSLLAIRESYKSAGFTNVESTDYEIGDVVFVK